MKIYALYKGDNLLSVGTLDEISEDMGIKKTILSCYGSPSRQNKYKNGRILVELTEPEKKLLNSEKCFADKGKDCRVLNLKDCHGCGFYKTQEQLDESIKRSQKRLKRLGGVGAKQIGEISVAVLEEEPWLHYCEVIEKAKEIYTDR